MSEMSFPDVGDHSIALLAVPDSFPITAAFVVVGVDDKILVLTGIGEGAEADLLEGLVDTAVDRLD